MSELVPLLVLVPILAGVIPPVLATVRTRSGWPVAAVALTGQSVMAVALLRDVVANGPVEYVVGGVPAQYGIELVVDGVSAVLVVLVALVATGVLAYTRTAGPRSGPFYALYLLLVAGLTGICVTNDVFTLYVFLEITGITSYALVAQSPKGTAAVAALRYLFLGTIAASFYLLGVGYAYAATGTLNMTVLAAAFETAGHGSLLVVAAYGFMLVGLAIKVAAVPLHGWLPDAHANAPVGVSVLLSGLVTTAAAYAILRLVVSVFTPAFFVVNPFAGDLLVALGALSIVVGAVLADRQRTVKRLLAYSTVSQFGVVLVGIGLANEVALQGAVVHLVGHAVMKGGLFLAAGVIAVGWGVTTTDDYAGIARRAPIASAGFAVAALGMVGLPPTVGFVGKWYVVLGALEAGAWPAAAVVVGSSMLSLRYFGRLLHAMYFAHPSGTDADSMSPSAASTVPVGTVSMGMRAVVALAAIVTVVLGVGTSGMERLIELSLHLLI